MSIIAVDQITDSNGGNSTTVNGATPTIYNTMGRNRLINGDMRIDQRNAGASVALSGTGQYIVDRWKCRLDASSSSTGQQVSDAPDGFNNSIKITIGTGASPSSSQMGWVNQFTEGLNISDLGFGTANAKTVTVSFWVKSSVTGAFSGVIKNQSTSAYPFEYTISSANTWEQKSVTIAGDTANTWGTDNSFGIGVFFDLGSGTTYQATDGSWASGNYFSATGATSLCETSGATWYITGVQLEVGSVATEFERRPYGTELALCQRYCYVFRGVNADATLGSGNGYATSAINIMCSVPVSMRSSPSLSTSSGNWLYYATGSSSAVQSATPVVGDTSTSNPSSFRLYLGGISGITTGANYWVLVNTNHYLALSAEL